MAKDLVGSLDERDRRREFKRRIDLLLDDGATGVIEQAGRQFHTTEVFNAMKEAAPMACLVSLMRRVATEIARPVYSVPPARAVDSAPAATSYAKISKQIRLNERLNLGCFLLVGVNTLHFHPRWTKRLGPVLDVVTPDHESVIPDPDDPTRELAWIYDSIVLGPDGKPETLHTYWDDTIAFRWASSGREVLIEGLDGQRHKVLDKSNGHPGFIPIVSVHARERWGTYWDTQTGKSLVAASEFCDLLMTLVLNLHKSQGFKQWVAQGATGTMNRDQVLSESGVLIVPEGVSVTLLDNRSDAAHYLATLEFVINHVAANNGINRERMNQENKQVADHVGLLERRAEMIRIFRDAEHRLFDLIRKLSTGRPEAIAESAKFSIDFAEISHKVDRETLLRIRKEEKSQASRSAVDDALEDQPELEGDRAAALEDIKRTMREQAEVIKLQRELNLPADATAEEPGQSPEKNGALGPKVKSGAMSKDEAAEQARTGPPPRATT